MAYDSESDRVILFGGQRDPNDTTSVTNETWAYDANGDVWTNMAPSSRPPALGFSGFTYDAESDRIILFGGLSSQPPSNPLITHSETWAYDFNSNTWTDMNPSGTPPRRCCLGMAYDADSDRVILYGGFDDPGFEKGDTWAYDYNSNTWVSMAPTTGPPLLANGRLAYDSESDVTVMFGGQGAGFVESNETWAYDFNTNSWTDMSPQVSPTPRDTHSLSYDIESDRVILIGDAPDQEETWAYDFNNNTWTDMNSPSPPPTRDFPSTAYDAESDRVVLFGGSTDVGTFLGDTWTYDFQPNLPSSPQNLEASGGDGLVNLAWDPPATNAGSAVMAYRIYRGTTTGSLSQIDEVGDVLSYTDSGVTNGIAYFHAVSAVNGVGEGPSSEVGPTTPKGFPSAPRNLAATSPDSHVALAWQEPSSDGGSAITNYRIYRGTVAGDLSLLTEIENVLTHTDSSVTLDLTYFFAVSAVNAAGEGPPSQEASTTVTDSTDPTITIEVPASDATLGTTDATVSGTATDNVAVELVEISLDQTTWISATGTDSWSGSLTLSEGPSTIYARATDTSGNTATASVSVTVSTGPDLTPIILAGGIAAAAIAVAVILFLLFRRRRGGTG